MAEKVTQASFIPKRPIDQEPGTKVKRKKSVGLYSVLAWILFIVTLGLAGGAFFYKRLQENVRAEKREQLILVNDEFDRGIVSDLASLDTRMKTAEQILERHVAVTPFFELLEQLTLETIQFTTFTFTRTGGAQYNIVMGGVADSFNSIALQSDVLGANQLISSPLFTNFGLNEEEDTVIFNVDLPVSSSLFRYNYNFNN